MIIRLFFFWPNVFVKDVPVCSPLSLVFFFFFFGELRGGGGGDGRIHERATWKGVGTEAEDGALWNWRRRQGKREGGTMINDAGNGAMFPTIKASHTISIANWSTIHKRMIISDTAHQLLPGHNNTKNTIKGKEWGVWKQSPSPCNMLPWTACLLVMGSFYNFFF